MKIRFHESAREDIRSASRFLNEQKQDLGDEFLDDLQGLLESIAENPLQFGAAPGSLLKHSLRVARFHRFQYVAYFKILDQRSIVLIYAVVHGHRGPGVWRERLDDDIDLDIE